MQQINKVLDRFNIQPVLIDVGASGEPPKVWKPIASKSTYVGFDPDNRELHDTREGQFARSIIVNQAVMNISDGNSVRFYLTRSPFCSSTLLPDTRSLSNYLFSNKFVVEREVVVPVSTLSSVLEQLEISTVDWFKTDSQGTDLRLFQSLPDKLRHKVLAVDIEPGLIDAYVGEDLFVDAHRELIVQGFWLSSLNLKGTIRLRRTTLQHLASQGVELVDSDVHRAIRQSPGWCEATYLRTLESLDQQHADERDYVLLWVFALVQEQLGYALDIACSYEHRYGRNDTSSLLYTLPVQLIANKNRGVVATVKKFVPNRLKTFLKQLTRGMLT